MDQYVSAIRRHNVAILLSLHSATRATPPPPNSLPGLKDIHHLIRIPTSTDLWIMSTDRELWRDPIMVAADHGQKICKTGRGIPSMWLFLRASELKLFQANSVIKALKEGILSLQQQVHQLQEQLKVREDLSQKETKIDLGYCLERREYL
ncbi:unnamed protein product [Pleuronectes platessa]|uniref:Uncharacterized protein n=1 Tax=Pleuronectes platessa TaxID=8262 RepID=A0A9N7VFF2_PLEPL|nr:unnamed protein product [Pleuronectes platessa]